MRPIDADALKTHVCEMCDDGQRECKGDESCAILCWINDMPTIEAEPVRHGRWEYRHADDWMFCTACGADAEGNYDEPLETDFCPHCGADMREECDDNA